MLILLGVALVILLLVLGGCGYAWGRKDVTSTTDRTVGYRSPHKIPSPPSRRACGGDWSRWHYAREAFATATNDTHSNVCFLGGNDQWLSADACRTCWYDTMLSFVTETNPPSDI